MNIKEPVPVVDWEKEFIQLKAPAGWEKMGAREFAAQLMVKQMGFIRNLLPTSIPLSTVIGRWG